jgi:hypothetical protein
MLSVVVIVASSRAQFTVERLIAIGCLKVALVAVEHEFRAAGIALE